MATGLGALTYAGKSAETPPAQFTPDTGFLICQFQWYYAQIYLWKYSEKENLGCILGFGASTRPPKKLPSNSQNFPQIAWKAAYDKDATIRGA